MRKLSTRQLLITVGLGMAACLVGCGGSGDSTGKADAGGQAGGSGGASPIAGDAATGSPTWTSVGGRKVAAAGTASFGRIVSVNGTTYAAFADSTLAGKLTVMKSTGADWTFVGVAGFTPSAADPTSYTLYVDNGTPYVAMSDADTGVLSVMKFNGTAWELVGTTGFASGDSSNMTLIVVGARPYLAFVDSDGVPHVMSYSAGAWTEAATGIPADASHLMFGTDGRASYVAYNDATNSSLTLAKLDGAVWTTVATTDVVCDESWAGTISISQGTLFLTYYNTAQGAVVMKLVGSALESVGTLGSISNGDAIEAVSGTAYNGVPYVAFDDESKDGDIDPRAARVMRWDGAKWSLYAGYANVCDIEDTVLYADQSSGHLYLTYSDCDGDMTVQVDK